MAGDQPSVCLLYTSIAQMPADNLLRRVYDQLFGGAVGYELRSSGVAAAEPSQLALTVDGQLYGVQYNLTDVAVSYTHLAYRAEDGTYIPARFYLQQES